MVHTTSRRNNDGLVAETNTQYRNIGLTSKPRHHDPGFLGSPRTGRKDHQVRLKTSKMSLKILE
jgi:hypothetical protein